MSTTTPDYPADDGLVVGVWQAHYDAPTIGSSRSYRVDAPTFVTSAQSPRVARESARLWAELVGATWDSFACQHVHNEVRDGRLVVTCVATYRP